MASAANKSGFLQTAVSNAPLAQSQICALLQRGASDTALGFLANFVLAEHRSTVIGGFRTFLFQSVLWICASVPYCMIPDRRNFPSLGIKKARGPSAIMRITARRTTAWILNDIKLAPA